MSHRETFIRHFTFAMTWTDLIDPAKGGQESGSKPYEYGWDDLTPESQAKVADLCDRFMEAAGDKLDAFAAAMASYPSDGWEQAGHDFYLTAGGHGTGYWDRDLGSLGDDLTEIARQFQGEVEGSLGPVLLTDGRIEV